jgi:hypothetical protein
MHASDILKYGHYTMLRPLDGLTDAEWYAPGVCGIWSVKDIMAHIASCEQVLIAILTDFPGGSAPLLDRFIHDGLQFNDAEVAARLGSSPQAILAEYNEAYTQAASLISAIPPEKCRQAGALAWYGADYDLEDFLVYSYYGHKREHAAQINVFRDELARGLRSLA